MAKSSLLTRVRNHFARASNPEAVRNAQLRKQLQSAVVDAMAGAGILSAHYRFKVLTLLGDQKALVLVFNLEHPLAGGQQQAAGLELRIRLLAQARFGLQVHAVYWRVDSLVRIEPRPPVAAASPAAPPSRVSPKVSPGFEDTQPWQSTIACTEAEDSDYRFAAPAASDLIGLYELPAR